MQIGYRLDAARSGLGRSRAMLRAGRRTRTADVLAEMRRRFAEMGVSLWEAGAVEELDRAATGRAAEELTTADQHVAALVLDGKGIGRSARRCS